MRVEAELCIIRIQNGPKTVDNVRRIVYVYYHILFTIRIVFM